YNIAKVQRGGREWNIGPVSDESACVVIGQAIDNVGDRHAVADDFAKDGEAAVLVVEIRRIIRFVEEPLAGGAVDVAADLGHGNCAAHVGDAGFVLNGRERGDRIDGDVAPVDGIIIAATLDDEVGNRAMHDVVCVLSIVDVSQKIGHGDGGLLV